MHLYTVTPIHIKKKSVAGYLKEMVIALCKELGKNKPPQRKKKRGFSFSFILTNSALPMGMKKSKLSKQSLQFANVDTPIYLFLKAIQRMIYCTAQNFLETSYA